MGVARARSVASTRGLTLDDTNGGSTKVGDLCDSDGDRDDRDNGDNGDNGDDGSDRDNAGNYAGSADSGGAGAGCDPGGASAGRGGSCDRRWGAGTSLIG